MPQITELELKNHIKEHKFKCIYFLFGDEKYLIKHYSNLLIDKLLGSNYLDFNYQSFDGSSLKVDEVADAVESLPIMAEKKCVKISDLNIEEMVTQEINKLDELIKSIPESTVLLISQSTLDINIKKSAKWRNFINEIKKVGIAADICRMSQVSLEKYIINLAKKRNITLSSMNANKIIKLCGTNLLNLQNEMEKICAFVTSDEIKESDIDCIITKNLETNVFALSNALIAGDYSKSYKQLNLLFYQREEPVAILAVLASAYIDMYRVRIAIESGEPSSVLLKDFDYKNKEFKIRNAERDIRRVSTNLIKESINIIAQTDILLKSSKTDSKILMEEMLSRLLLASKRGI